MFNIILSTIDVQSVLAFFSDTSSSVKRVALGDSESAVKTPAASTAASTVETAANDAGTDFPGPAAVVEASVAATAAAATATATATVTVDDTAPVTVAGEPGSTGERSVHMCATFLILASNFLTLCMKSCMSCGTRHIC